MHYSHGIQTTLVKAKDETENDMKSVKLAKKQFIARMVQKRIDKGTQEYQFIDQNSNLILRLPYSMPQGKDEFGRYVDDTEYFVMPEGTLFSLWACGRHQNDLQLFRLNACSLLK